MRAVVGGLTHSPAGSDGPQGVVGPFTSTVELVAQQLELGLERSDAHAEDDPAMAGHVEGAPPLHELEGMVVAEHDDVAQQRDPLRRGGHEA